MRRKRHSAEQIVKKLRTATRVPCDRRRSLAQLGERPGAAGLPVCLPGSPGTHPLGQRLRVYGPGRPELAGEDRREDALHRTGLALGERLRRELQRQAARRATQAGALLHAEGGEGPDRELALGVQSLPAAQRAGIPSSSTRGDRAATTPARRGSNLKSGTTCSGQVRRNSAVSQVVS